MQVKGAVRACGLSHDCRHLLVAMGPGYVVRHEAVIEPAKQATPVEDEAGEKDWVFPRSEVAHKNINDLHFSSPRTRREPEVRSCLPHMNVTGGVLLQLCLKRSGRLVVCIAKDLTVMNCSGYRI